MVFDWTRSETISKPDLLKIDYAVKAPPGSAQTHVKKSVTLPSTTSSSSVSVYETIQYIDAEGKPQQADVLIRKTDIKSTTMASANPDLVKWMLSNDLGLPSGGAVTISVTEYFYSYAGSDGPTLIKERTQEDITSAEFMGGLAMPNYYTYAWPLTQLIPVQITEIIYEHSKTAKGRDYTRTKTSRWIVFGKLQEGQQWFANAVKEFRAKGLLKERSDLDETSSTLITALLNALLETKFQGTEIQVNIGRAPTPSRPSASELAVNEVVNGPDTTTSVVDNAGSGSWQNYIPPGIDPATLAGDSNGDGIPDWAPYVPDTWQDYNQDSNNDGIPDWASYTPTSWQDFNQDSNGDGTLDWVPFVPVQWQDFNQDSNNDGIPDWATFVPDTWQDYSQDSNGDGIPDWQPFVPGPWQNYNQDSNGDGIPDWEPFVPVGWQDFNQDSNNDGIPDWQPYVPNTPSAWNQDSNGDGIPDWEPYVPTNWQDFNQDSNNDGIPDWEPYVPVGWQDFDPTGTTYNPGTTEVSLEKTLTGIAIFNGGTYNAADTTVTATYDMPFAPDDHFEIVNGIKKLIRGNAALAAAAFGRMESALDIGHAFGQNIVSGFSELPSLPLSPLYLRIGGIEGAFLLDSLSYAWGSEGMVVSSDLMLVGAVGYYGTNAPTTSWIRLPVSTASLSAAPAVVSNPLTVKANSIPIPTTFTPSTAAASLPLLPVTGSDVFQAQRLSASIVPPTLQVEIFKLSTGPFLLASEVSYSLIPEIENFVVLSGAASSGSVFSFVQIQTASIDVLALAPAIRTGASVKATASVIAITATAPAISTGKAVKPSVTDVAVMGVAPRISTGASAAIPVSDILTAGQIPIAIGYRAYVEIPAPPIVNLNAPQPSVKIGTAVNVPITSISVTAVAPDLFLGVFVEVPTAVMLISAPTPEQVGINKDDYFSAYSLQLFSFDRDWRPDWWAD